MANFCSNKDYKNTVEVDQDHTDVLVIEPVEGGWLVFQDAKEWANWKGCD